MYRFIKPVLLLSFYFLLFSLLPSVAHAQIADPNGDPDLPIDGGISLLVAAGVGYGVKKYRDEKKKNNEMNC